MNIDLATMAVKMSPVFIDSYNAGMSPGMHIDAPVVPGVLTDFSMTLFLCDSGSYEGEKLLFESELEAAKIKLPAGDANLCEQ